MLKLTETLRSEPMLLNIPNVVPPTPPITCVPPNVVGAPLISNLQNSGELSRVEVQEAGYDRVKALGAFFDYQAGSTIYVRRMVLTIPCSTLSGKRTRDYAKARGSVTVCGSAFGTTLGSLCAYLEGRGLQGERAYVLRSVRTQLLPIAEALKTIHGDDAVYLSRGLASCRVAQAQRLTINEPLSRIDSKYGNPFTCIGATATILTCFGIMSSIPDHARHLQIDNAFVKTLRIVLQQLQHWRSSSVVMADDAWSALEAERRALRRAADAARLACYVYQDAAPGEILRLQLLWARMAAFPTNERVDEFSQTTILRRIETQELFRSCPKSGKPHALVTETVPLSQISASAFITNRKKNGKQPSDASSSWASVSSNGSSAFSHVSSGSVKSLDGVLVSKFLDL